MCAFSVSQYLQKIKKVSSPYKLMQNVEIMILKIIFLHFFLNFKLQFFSIKTPHIFLGRTYFFSFLFLIEFLFTFILLEMGNNSMHQM